jgi:hypothetical protein
MTVALVFDQLFIDLHDLGVTATFEYGLKGLDIKEVVFLDLDDLEFGIDEAAQADFVVVETNGEVSLERFGLIAAEAENSWMLSSALGPVDEALDGLGIPWGFPVRGFSGFATTIGRGLPRLW